MKWLKSTFVMNGILWRVLPVSPFSSELIDRTHNLTVATTDPIDHVIYIADNLPDDFGATVFIHELGHAAMVSFGLLDDIRRMAKPDYWIELEEWVCNLIADHGKAIFSVAYQMIGYDAVHIARKEIERLIA